MKTDNLYIKGIFLLVLAVSGNFIAETLSCKTQKLLRNNMFAKQVILLSILYFAINFTSEVQSPLETAKKALLIWIGFLLFAKMHVSMTIFVFLLLCLAFVLSNQIDYLEKINEKESISQLELFQQSLHYIIIASILIGVSVYGKEKYEEYKGNFNIITFLLGNQTCKSA